MKVMIYLLSVVVLLTGLPLLQAFLVFQNIEEFARVSSATSFFYLFTIPAWTLVIIIFVIETYRRSFIPSKFRMGNTLMLGLSGLIAPTAGFALSPVAGDIDLVAFAVIAVLGFLVGLLGALLFNFVVGRIKKMGDV